MSTFTTRKAICEIFHKLNDSRRSRGFLIFTFGLRVGPVGRQNHDPLEDLGAEPTSRRRFSARGKCPRIFATKGLGAG